ncbi:helix-turn-helix domain-containing protein, partial [Rhizobium wenxiniae]
EIGGEVFPLPRRERRIPEYLVANRGRRVSKAQIFSAIYGIFDEDVEENVVESHISKLRKKLRKKLGTDPIDSKRFLGYCIDWN